MPGNNMKEIGLNHCYDLYYEKFGESIQNILEQTITEIEKEINTKTDAFINTYFINPSKLERAERNSSLFETEMLREILNSKNILLENLNSQYIHLYLNYWQDIPEMARRITWYWLSSPRLKTSMPLQFRFNELKETLISVGFNLGIYNFNDRFPSIFEKYGVTIEWPKTANLEIYKIKQLEEQLSLQKGLSAELDRNKRQWLDEEMEAKGRLQKELRQKEHELLDCKIELLQLKDDYFFHEDNFYKDYVFGDILPELKSVYDLLKYYKLYDSNWGYFCSCLTCYNATSKNSTHQKLTLNIQNSEFTADDLGYILHLLKKHYQNESELPFIQWVMANIEIISGHGKIFKIEEDYIKFNEKSIRSYKSGKSRPNFYHEINLKLQALL
jgi:hypothetical protein